MGAGLSSKSSTGSSIPDYDSCETDSSNEISSMDDLWDLTTCIIQLERKLEDAELEAMLNHAMYPDRVNGCKDEKKELHKRLELLKSRQHKVYKSITRPKKISRKPSPIIVMCKQREKLMKKTHSRSMIIPTECRQLSFRSLDETYRKYSQQPNHNLCNRSLNSSVLI